MTATMEERIAELAARQHGVVTRPQLLAAGVTARMVVRRLEAKRLRSLHRGVYLAGPLAPARAREMAAVLACGAGARASHRSAAWLWGLGARPGGSTLADVKVPARRVVRRPGIRVHRASHLEAEEVAIVDGIPATDPSGTLLDLAGLLGARELEKAVARAERTSLIRSDELGSLVARHRGRRGMATLAALLEQDGGPAFTRSALEDRFVDEVREFGLDEPKYNVWIGGYELDCFWPDARMALELDGEAYHASWQTQQNDRRRDRDLAGLDIHVIRVTWYQLVHETAPTMVKVAEALAVRRERLRRDRDR